MDSISINCGNLVQILAQIYVNINCKKCVQLFTKKLFSVKLALSTNFSFFTHNVLHTSSTPITNQLFPHFHSPYYYYYYYYLFSKDQKKGSLWK